MKIPVLALAFIGLLLTAPRALQAEVRVESNVIYGMYSGLALLMDVHHPERPNGYGIVFIGGSGWHASLGLDSMPLKESVQWEYLAGAELLAGGYTLFSISHRAAPRFRYPAAVEDAQRAVKYVRHHAERFGVEPDHLGAVGASSGGHLALMLGLVDEAVTDTSPIGNESARVQAVVALNPPTDLPALRSERSAATVASFLGNVLTPWREPDSPEFLLWQEASPLFHLSAGDPPVLLIHGDADPVIPYSQSEEFLQALREQGLVGNLILLPGAGHVWEVADVPEYRSAMVAWFDTHLRGLPINPGDPKGSADSPP